MNSDIVQQTLDPVQRVKAWLASYWRKDAGSSVDKMLQDRTDAEYQLTNPDWKVRCTALSILQLHWGAGTDANFGARCEDLGLHDLHPQVRSCALIQLGMCFENTNDLRIGKLLAQVVLDETQPDQPRRGAYLGLYDLRGRSFEWAGARADPPSILRIPEDVDWSFVKSFLED